jgi:hypothetical protein
MSITSKGKTINTTTYTEVLPEYSFRIVTEFINTGATPLKIVVGGTLAEAVDANSIPVDVGLSYNSPMPVAGPVFIKGTSVVVVANGQE